MKKYGFNVLWSEEDQGFIATCPDFVGLSAFGETVEESLAEAKIALDGFCESLTERNVSLPEVTSQPECSGQTRLRMPVSLHQELTLSARREGVSLNQYMVYLLSERASANTIINKVDEHLTQIRKVVDIGNKAIESALVTWSVKVDRLPEETLAPYSGESHARTHFSIN